ncbi:hypothetical protein [Chitinophaga filiformis]|uniref:Uncharacterized protein n=1 Tax=Chitinophaga filiformis TaxID=104663 RepID=A0ABY4IA04_CHIFI|nr:hypothetical protein [Chitinophaga filiformis]UPK72390.1 hypothetical protein MYF79_13945 [Chitinophaga filiformis]
MTANRIIQHIFQQPDIKQVDEAALERLVTSYPYFTAARLLLARKQYSVQKNLLAPAVKKAQQYSTNMHYFYRFVTTDEKSVVPEVVAPVAEEATPVAAETTPITAEAISMTAEAAPAAPVTAEVTAEAAPAPVAEAPVSAFPGQAETAAPAAQPVQETKIHVTVPKAPAEQAAPETNFTAATYNTEEELTVTADDVVATPATPPPFQAAPATATPATEAAPVHTQEPVVGSPVTSLPAAAQAPATPAADNPVSTAPAAETEPIKIFPLDTSETETSLTFQPLYTDDYFAYKRLKEPEQAEQLSEKGAAEMKSFTSWLREMKHTFAEKASKQWYHQQMHRSYEDPDPEVSEAVEKMAMDSITLNDDIVSETLAEIWARQHQYQTAIHIYQKLSLLNPNKSAYFAQKIKELQLLTEKS